MEASIFVKGIREKNRLTQWVQLNMVFLAFTLSFFPSEPSISVLSHTINPSIYDITQCLRITAHQKSSRINELKNRLFNIMSLTRNICGDF